MAESEQLITQQLMSRIAAGDKQAFTVLYNEYAELIFSVATYVTKDRQLAEDTVQFVFLKVWERAADLASMENAVGWMRNTARFYIINAFKKQVAEKHVYLSMEKSEEPTDPAELLMNKKRTEFLHNAVQSLPPRQQEVYLLSREQGLTYAEIARLLSVSHETVKEHMARALKTIKQMLDRDKDLLLMLVGIIGILF